MVYRDFPDAITLYCKSCGELVQVAGTLEDDTLVLCIRCAISAAAQAPKREAALDDDAPYEPTDRERQWWQFLSWLIATRRLSVGPGEGADDPLLAPQHNA